MSKLEKLIKDYLIEKEIYHESDDILIKEIGFNMEMLEEAKQDIRTNGLTINITRNTVKDPFYQKNRNVDVYQQALKNIQGLFRQLILSPSERHKMKVELLKEMDNFEEIFNKK